MDAETLLGWRVSDTTLRARRDEWIAAGVFKALAGEALATYDRIIGLDFSECSVDGSQYKAPAGGEGTGPNPTDRAKSGWKWSLLADANGIPAGWATDGANRHDTILLEPTLTMVAERGLLADVETFHLDRGYDNGVVGALVARHGKIGDGATVYLMGGGRPDHQGPRLLEAPTIRHRRRQEARPSRDALAHRTHQQLAQ